MEKMNFAGWKISQIIGTDTFLPNSIGGLHIGDDLLLGDRDQANSGILIGGQSPLTAKLIFGYDGSSFGSNISNNGTTDKLYINNQEICVKNTTQGYFPVFYITSSVDANTLVNDGIYLTKAALTNCPTTNHCVLLVCRNIGTPFQIFFPDNQPHIYKRWGLTDGQFKSNWYKSADFTAVT